ncbi:MAG: GIY-YIG nuclease family protein [Ignavibacteria bacterium]|nr:GIY-YIG nuclease family protein [Ignavibacteria bacterium]
MNYYVYLIASGKNGTLYVGMTNNLIRRSVEHKKGLVNGFTRKYKVDKLVYYEETKYVNNAIMREKQVKGWNRKKKIDLIVSMNPEWKDLFYEIGGNDEMLNQDFSVGHY